MLCCDATECAAGLVDDPISPIPDYRVIVSLSSLMSRHTLDLGSLQWQLGQAPRQPFHAEQADDRAEVREWLPATVPGDVRADLIAAGRIPPVDTPEGIAAGGWVDDWDWWYRAELPDVGQFAKLPYGLPCGRFSLNHRRQR